ncbi:MAG TPA: cupin domain-containing protein [Bacteroidia bacterium]|nr:cupin domain-containing protein [Bacteroidia bacterium]
MELINDKYFVKHYQIWSDGIFPSSNLDVLLYKKVFNLPFFFPARAIKELFKKNNWYNDWKDGIYTYHHYHSNTHEVLGVYEGDAIIEFGGETGVKIEIEKGDVLVIPAGVAHKNLGDKNQIKCVGACPNGENFDMNYGKPDEYPKAIENIRNVKIPLKDPVFGLHGEIQHYWKSK